jgi:hypothetical protein
MGHLISPQAAWDRGALAVLALVAAAGGAGGGCPCPADARSLRATLAELTTFGGLTVPSETIETGVELERLAVASSDYVPTATAPGFFYRFDPELGAPERVSTARGPVFAEPTETVGAGNVDLGLIYLYADYSELDGESLTDALESLDTISPAEQTIFRVQADQFELRSHTFLFSATYGLTDRWDMNLLTPLILTSMNLRARSDLLVGLLQTTKRVDASEDKLGIGDLQLRSKYRVPDRAGVAGAVLFSLRVPTGDADNFQGLGDVVLAPLFAVSRKIGPHDLHLNAGFDVNTGDFDRTRARYALGLTAHLLEPLSGLVDIVGTSGLTSDHFTTRGVSGTIERTDLVDLATGFKVTITDRFLAHLGVLVPLTDDGLRADVIPTGGIQASF